MVIHGNRRDEIILHIGKNIGIYNNSISLFLCPVAGGLFKLFLNCFLEWYLSPENPENRKKIGQVVLTYPVLFLNI